MKGSDIRTELGGISEEQDANVAVERLSEVIEEASETMDRFCYPKTEGHVKRFIALAAGHSDEEARNVLAALAGWFASRLEELATEHRDSSILFISAPGKPAKSSGKQASSSGAVRTL